MFCSECGKPTKGKFCSYCGTCLETPTGTDVSADWKDEARYDVLLRVPAFRAAVDRHVPLAPKRLSPEKFLEFCDALAGSPVSSTTIMNVAQPLYARLGVGTGKKRTESIDAPIGHVLCRALCSLARRGQMVRYVRQAADGCVVEAAIPAGMTAFEGTLVIAVHRDGLRTAVEAAATIAGQLFDWGKCNTCLNTFFADLRVPAEEASD